jgi:hypothetical protein
MFREAGFLNVFEKRWDGGLVPSAAFVALNSYLSSPYARR